MKVYEIISSPRTLHNPSRPKGTSKKVKKPQYARGNNEQREMDPPPFWLPPSIADNHINPDKS